VSDDAIVDDAAREWTRNAENESTHSSDAESLDSKDSEGSDSSTTGEGFFSRNFVSVVIVTVSQFAFPCVVLALFRDGKIHWGSIWAPPKRSQRASVSARVFVVIRARAQCFVVIRARAHNGAPTV